MGVTTGEKGQVSVSLLYKSDEFLRNAWAAFDSNLASHVLDTMRQCLSDTSLVACVSRFWTDGHL